MRRLLVRTSIALLVLFHLAALLAGFFAPYDYSEQAREFPYAPPSRLRLARGNGGLKLFSYRWRADRNGRYEEDTSAQIPIHFFTRGSRYFVLGSWCCNWSSDVHLFAVAPGERVFLLGTDAFGRDQLSRLLFGARISLLSGLIATIIALSLGSLFGAIAGFGGWLDEVIMRITEISLAIPSVYLLLMTRALLPLKTAPETLFLILVVIIGATGWGRPARLIRGVVLTVKQREFVTVARGFGATELYLLRRHILPHVAGVILTQFAVLVPQYLLAEVTLSFAGLGMNEPVPSWGNMLAPLRQYAVLDADWWMFAPAIATIPIAFAWYVLSVSYAEDRY